MEEKVLREKEPQEKILEKKKFKKKIEEKKKMRDVLYTNMIPPKVHDLRGWCDYPTKVPPKYTTWEAIEIMYLTNAPRT